MKLGVITSNLGKMEEYRAALEDAGIEVEHLDVPYVEIQTSKLEDVVRKGIDELRDKGYRDFIIDDSGLFIDALGGFPGVYSSYAQKTIGNKGILALMEDENNRKAEFRCCIGCTTGGRTMIISGSCGGIIMREERGDGGFGFDPIFSNNGKESFAEMTLEEKNSVSHRGVALKGLIIELTKE